MSDNLPLISVVTVTFNAADILEETIRSVVNQTYPRVEYIIIDGGSTDNTLDIIKKYQDKISYSISEPDKGIYDAMNKGLRFVSGDWVNFMNAGDIFANNNVLSDIFVLGTIPDKKEFIYSDFYTKEGTQIEKRIADFDKGVVLHQSVIYKPTLHHRFGIYVVTEKIIISDYLFFNSIPKNLIYKSSISISINEKGGISSSIWCFQQKLCADYIFHRLSFYEIFKKSLILKFKIISRYFIPRIITKNIKKMIRA